jgi:hypothetical protein
VDSAICGEFSVAATVASLSQNHGDCSVFDRLIAENHAHDALDGFKVRFRQVIAD